MLKAKKCKEDGLQNMRINSAQIIMKTLGRHCKRKGHSWKLRELSGVSAEECRYGRGKAYTFSPDCLTEYWTKNKNNDLQKKK